MQFSLHQQWVLRLQIVIDYIVDIAFFLALGSLGTDQPGLVSLHQRGLLCILFPWPPYIQSKVHRECKMEFPFFSKWSQSSQGNLFLSFFIFSSDLHNWVQRRLTRMT